MLPRSAPEPTRRPARGPNPVSSEADAPALPDLGHGRHRPFVLPALPYAEGALAPTISARTMHYHYHRHHAGYVATLNRLLADSLPTDPTLASQSLISIIRSSADNAARTGLFNNAAQVWNHSFYWRCLLPGGGGRPGGAIASAIDRTFGHYATFREHMIGAAVGQFGSGWAWLCVEGDRLTIRRTANARTPVQVPGLTPLLTIDVWEHAYYLDSQNRRADHVTQVVDRLLNWPFVNAILEAHQRALNPVPAQRLAPTGNLPTTTAIHTPRLPAPVPSPAPSWQVADTRAASFARLARRR